MKSFLHTTPYFLLLLALAYIPPETYGQCTCSNGDPATALTHYIRLDTSDAPSSTISFPKFNPSIGILSCVTFKDTLSLVSTSEVINTASVPVTYRFLLSVTNDIAGPFIGLGESATRNYGPTLLGQAGGATDRTVYGPDTLFKYSSHSTSPSGVAAYMGSSGTVDFVYTVNGGLISTQGGINYLYSIVSKYWGGFSLTYYWCPNIVLATNIKNFAAYKKDNTVLLKWITDNNTPGTNYKIEFSTDGNNFISVGQLDPNDLMGTSTQHEFQYAPGNSTSGKIYFRIRETDPQGKITYSPIRVVNLNDSEAGGFVIYPNPVDRKVSMQFDRTLTWNYLVEITNLSGQVVYNRNFKLANASNFQFDINNPPPPGMYYLKMTDTKTKLNYSKKLIIGR